MTRFIKLLSFTGMVSVLLMTGCKKFLDEKQDQSLTIPETVQDLQSLMDDYVPINLNLPSAGEVSADDYYLEYNAWQGRNEYIRRMYLWQPNVFSPNTSNDWVIAYMNVYRANVVLSNIDKVKRTSGDEAAWSNAKGSAHFLRGSTFAQVAWIWALAYDPQTASTDLGIPLRLDPDFNDRSTRANLQETYQQIIDDLKTSISLLPKTPVHVLRPSKPAAYGWLARVYLSMRSYDSASIYASKYLQSHQTLLDYNTLNGSSSSPITPYNVEVGYHTRLTRPITTAIVLVDSSLYRSYDENDLRKQVFFRNNGNGTYRFKGSYEGTTNPGAWSNGIATDEMFFIKAECEARAGNKETALDALNTVMGKRWKNNGTWVPFTAIDAEEALDKILIERRKELVGRGVRWADIKRLNKEGRNIILRRLLNGETFELLPNAPRYALPIPEDVIQLSGMPQN